MNVGPKQPNSSTVAATNKFSRAFGYISFPPLEKGGVGEDGVGECGGRFDECLAAASTWFRVHALTVRALKQQTEH